MEMCFKDSSVALLLVLLFIYFINYLEKEHPAAFFVLKIVSIVTNVSMMNMSNNVFIIKLKETYTADEIS